MSREITPQEYASLFGDKERRKVAHERALDIRKFEIGLYWKRAAYFWTFIAATFAGYGAIQASSSITPDNRKELSVALACLGIVFSVGWFFANKGSKQWQENWENHVDMLEDEFTGPLYKVVMKRPRPRRLKIISEFLIGPAAYSVSKINQIISIFVTGLWGILLWRSVRPSPM